MRRLLAVVMVAALAGCSDDAGGSSATMASATSTTIAALVGRCAEYTRAFAAGSTSGTEAVATARATFVSLEQDVPDELQPDVRTFITWFDELQQLYADHDNQSAEIVADPRFTQLFDDQAVIDANARIGAWLQQECAVGG